MTWILTAEPGAAVVVRSNYLKQREAEDVEGKRGTFYRKYVQPWGAAIIIDGETYLVHPLNVVPDGTDQRCPCCDESIAWRRTDFERIVGTCSADCDEWFVDRLRWWWDGPLVACATCDDRIPEAHASACDWCHVPLCGDHKQCCESARCHQDAWEAVHAPY